MTSSNRDNLSSLISVAVKAAVKDAMARTRVPVQLSGTVEQLDADKDVVWVRMDDEALGADPTESSNYEEPGVVPVAREGDAFTGDLARVRFEGAAGASATRTGTPNVIVLPFGAESGRRIVIDGDQGLIAQYDDADNLVGLISTDVWAQGQLDPPGARGTFDPVGGIRMRSADDRLVLALDQSGLRLTDAASGMVTAEVSPGRLRLVDEAGVDDIEMVTSSASTLPNPAYRVAAEAIPLTTLVAPAAPVFTTTPADDIELLHVASWVRAADQPTAVTTPPAGTTERLDAVMADPVGTLHVTVATRDPASGASGTFTSNFSNWQYAVGTHVVIKGGGSTSPAWRSLVTATVQTSGATAVLSATNPSGLAVDDVMILFVSLGVSGGFVPTGWVVPPGWIELGAFPITSGSGSSQSSLATGAWAKHVTADDVAASSHQTTINLPTGVKKIHGALTAVSGAALVPGGVQIRMAGRPIRRKLAEVELQSASGTLADFQNISQAYDNLEIVYDATVSAGAAGSRAVLRFNGDTATTNYFSQVTSDGTITTEFQSAARILMGGTITNGAISGGRINIFGYARSGRSFILGDAYWVNSIDLRDDSIVGQWGTTPITRIQILNSGAATYAAGSRAYLYGY